MEKIYLVQFHMPYEGCEAKFAYKNKEDAEKECKKLNHQLLLNGNTYDDYNVKEIELFSQP